MARPRKIPRDEAEARRLEQKRASHARHREENNRRQRQWYHANQASVRAQQSRYKEEAAAWKYRTPAHGDAEEPSSGEWWKFRSAAKRWYGTLGVAADRLSVINELELREPCYIFESPRGRREFERVESEDPLNWVHQFDRKGEHMDTNELHERHARERNRMHEKHDTERLDQLDRHRKERKALDTAHAHERKGGSRRTDEAILNEA